MIIDMGNGVTSICNSGHIRGLPDRLKPSLGTLCKCGEHEATWWEEDCTEPNDMFFLCVKCAVTLGAMMKLGYILGQSRQNLCLDGKVR